MATSSEAGDESFGFAFEKRRRISLLPDPGYLLMVFRRRLWLFVGAVALALSAVAAVMIMATPVYVATASILIEPRKTQAIDLQSVVQGLPADTNVVDTQTQIINSPTMALSVVRALRLDRDPEFVKSDAASYDSLVKPIVKQLPNMSAAERSAVSALLAKVNVKRAGLTYVIDVSARSSSADKAAMIANSFASQYITEDASHRSGLNEEAADFVARRAAELRKQAVADDAAVQQYMIANNLMSAQGATMAEQEVSQLNQQIAEAQAKLAQERGKLAAARGQLSRGGGADIGAVLASDTIRNLRAQESTASAELASLKTKYGEKYPDVQRAKDNLADIRKQIELERARIVSTLEANVQVAASGLSSLESSRGGARHSLASNSSAQVGLLELQRKAEASSAIYAAFLQRAKETAATADLPHADASISSAARLPDTPAWPNYRLAAIFGLLAAAIIGLVAISIAEYLDGSISTREDVENDLGVAYAGAVPDLKSSAGRENRGTPPYLYVLSHPFSTFAEAIRTVSTVATRNEASGGRIVTIVSALPREGKTTLAISLARLVALGRGKVVLVDGDLRRHSVSSILVPQENHEERLLRVLEGTLPLSDALVKDSATDLMILPTCGPTTAEDSLTPERVARLYEMLRTQFDVVIVDTAPVLGVVDTRELAAQSDATLMVCRWRHTAVKAARASVDILDNAGAKVVGVALSMVDIRQYASTGHSDAYGYHKKFTKYYVD